MKNMHGLFCRKETKKASTTEKKMVMKPKSKEPKEREEKEEDIKEDKKQELAIWDCGSPLYDSYELVSLSHLIERHFMILPISLGGSRRFITQFSRPGEAGHPMKSSAVSTKVAKGSSMVSRLSGFVEMKVLKRMVFGERKEKKSKKIKATRNCGFCSKIVPWRK